MRVKSSAKRDGCRASQTNNCERGIRWLLVPQFRCYWFGLVPFRQSRGPTTTGTATSATRQHFSTVGRPLDIGATNPAR